MSHHFDSPTAIEDGRLNLFDVYVFPEAPGTSTLILTVNPDSERSSPATFRADALYEFVIASDGGTGEDRALRMSFGEPDADGDQEMRVRYAAGGRAGLAWRAPNSASAVPGKPSRWAMADRRGSARRATHSGATPPRCSRSLRALPRTSTVPSCSPQPPATCSLAGTSPPSPFRSRTSRSAAPTSPCGPGSACTGTVPGGRSAGRPIRCCGRCSSRSPARTPRRSTPVRRRRRHVRRGRAGDYGACGRTSGPASLPAAGGPGPAGARLLAATSDQQIPCCRVAGGCRRVVLAARAGGL
jgi:hypothetical protein